MTCAPEPFWQALRIFQKNQKNLPQSLYYFLRICYNTNTVRNNYNNGGMNNGT